MLRPVLEIQSTAKELARLCQLLHQIKFECNDSNLVWKIAQLVSTVEEINEQFTDDFNLWHISYADENLYNKLFDGEGITAGLSLAFQSAALLDAAVYKAFTPSATFKDLVKLLRRNTLELLHEERGLR